MARHGLKYIKKNNSFLKRILPVNEAAKRV